MKVTSFINASSMPLLATWPFGRWPMKQLHSLQTKPLNRWTECMSWCSIHLPHPCLALQLLWMSVLNLHLGNKNKASRSVLQSLIHQCNYKALYEFAQSENTVRSAKHEYSRTQTVYILQAEPTPLSGPVWIATHFDGCSCFCCHTSHIPQCVWSLLVSIWI